ncbi:DNA polymerase thumb domain-containing protein [Thiocapsa imhoffii]|uniref:DNA polymerase thumb domain-containing protein n=1 Tax=Thiocapsa imhoffii TaxID=382777 RepID=UPI003530564E
MRPEDVRTFLDPLPRTALRGVGAVTVRRLEQAGLRTVGDVRARPLQDLRRLLGARTGTEVHLQSNGIAADRGLPHHRTSVDLQRDSLRRGSHGCQGRSEWFVVSRRPCPGGGQMGVEYATSAAISWTVSPNPVPAVRTRHRVSESCRGG